MIEAKMPNTSEVEISEQYEDYVPPEWVHDTVVKMLDSVPEKYLSSLSMVVLTNSGSLNRVEKRRRLSTKNKAKVSHKHVLGTYSPGWKGGQPAVTLYLDNIYLDCGTIILHWRLMREIFLAQTLFHEVGHHIHFTMAKEHAEKEKAAEKWKRRLIRNYFQTRYLWVRIFGRPIGLIVRAVVKIMDKTRGPG